MPYRKQMKIDFDDMGNMIDMQTIAWDTGKSFYPIFEDYYITFEKHVDLFKLIKYAIFQ